MSEIPITVRGDVDARAIEQLRRCATAGDAVAGVLCADGHVGYSQPIGGAVAYPDHISPSGVGYDIACIAEDELVLTARGLVRIQDVASDDAPLRPDADGTVAPVDPFVGVVAKGVRDVLRLTLADGRSVRLTPDHEVRTARGWVRADGLTAGDAVLCPAFLHLAGYINGDGHIPAHLRWTSVLTSMAEDVAGLVDDVAAAARHARGRRERMRSLCDGGVRVRDAAAAAAGATGTTPAVCIHPMYRDGVVRVPRDWHGASRALGDCVWVDVASVAPAGACMTYDLVTGDPAQAFVAGGITVHNCGNKAVRTDLRTEDLRPDLPRVMDEVFSRISFGVGRRNNEPVDHPVLDAIGDAAFAPQRQLRDLAAKQLGTVGAGNHYVDLFDGDDGFVWVGVHFGSRGFGHKTASGFLSLAAGGRFDERGRDGEMDSPPVLLAVDSELGQAYIDAMQLAGEYAYAGRDVVVDRVLEILGARSTYSVHNHHNFAWRERHGGIDAWVIRKGCTPAFPGQEGFVGATMGEPSVILRGADTPENADLLYSTVHGAGRVMSRTQARGKVRRGKVIRPGLIDFRAVRDELTRNWIELRGGAADEAPDAYKRLDAVLAAHGDTVEVLHRLTPIGVAMAPADTFDPYKD